MELQLNTWERVRLTQILGELRGNLAMLRKAGKAMDTLELDETEKAEVKFQTVVKENGGVGYQWQDAEHEFDVELRDREAVALLKRAFQQYEGWMVSELSQVEILAAKLNFSEVGNG